MPVVTYRHWPDLHSERLRERDLWQECSWKHETKTIYGSTYNWFSELSCNMWN